MFRYDAVAHRYFLDEVELPSVTRLLAPLHDFSGIAPQVLQHAADRGTAVHRMVELDCANDLDDGTIHPEIFPYVQAWRKFFVEWEPAIVASEKRVYHPTLRYAGTFDLKLDAREVRYYVDLKATAQIPPTVGLQIKAYQQAEQAMEPDGYAGLTKRAVLWLRKDGTYKFLEQEDQDWPVFLQLLTQFYANQKTHAMLAEWKTHH